MCGIFTKPQTVSQVFYKYNFSPPLQHTCDAGTIITYNLEKKKMRPKRVSDLLNILNVS